MHCVYKEKHGACYCTDMNRTLCKDWQPVKEKKQSGFGRNHKKVKAIKVSQRYKPTGEKEFVIREWQKRPHICFITGEMIHELKPINAFHILSKGAFPKYRLNPENLIFVQARFHHDWHILGQSACLAKDERWKHVIEMYEQLKKQYHNEHRA